MEPGPPETTPMSRTRKRARRSPSLAWGCAHARLEDRLLLSGSAEIADIASSSATAHTAARSEVDGPTPSREEGPGDVADLSPTPQVIDPETGLDDPPPTGVGGDEGGSSPVPPIPGGTLFNPSPSLGGGLTLDETEIGGMPGGSEAGPTLIGGPIGPLASGIPSPVLQPMETYYLSYNPLDDAALGILTTGNLGCASMASIIGEEGVVIADLSDPPSVPQPMIAPVSPRVQPPAAEAVEATPDGPLATVEAEPAPVAAPAAPEATSP
jgi:hypothetical protein